MPTLEQRLRKLKAIQQTHNELSDSRTMTMIREQVAQLEKQIIRMTSKGTRFEALVMDLQGDFPELATVASEEARELDL